MGEYKYPCDCFFSLGIDDLFDVKRKLLPLAARWRDIGLALRISDSKLEIIEDKRLNARECLTDMLRLWLNRAYDVEKYGVPSWQKLKDAVGSPAGGDSPAVADTLF